MSTTESTTPFVPAKPRRYNMFEVVSRKNPIAEQIADSAELKKMFSDFKFIPFAGEDQHTGHSLLKFLMSMRTLSDTHASCIETIKTYCFGSKIEFVKETDNVFDTGDDAGEVDKSIRKQYAEFLKGITINIGTHKDFAETIFDSYKSTGNAYYTLTLSQTLGNKKATINYYSAEKCMYYLTPKNEPKIIAVSPKFTTKYLNENPPLLVPVYPNFMTDELGNQVTIFHVKDGQFEWYGRPDSMQSFQSQYVEFQNANYLINTADNGFTGKVLIETEGDDPGNNSALSDDEKGAFDTIFERWQENYTQKGDDPASLIVFERPYGAKPTFVHEFSPNTNEGYFSTVGGIAKDKIIASHQWTERLLGKAAPSGLGNNAAMDDFKQRLPIIEGYQTMVATEINLVNKLIEDFYEERRFEGIGIKFISPYSKMMEEMAQVAQDAQGNKVGNGGAKVGNSTGETQNDNHL